MKQDKFPYCNPPRPEDIEGVEIVRVDGAAMLHIDTCKNPHLVEMLQRPYRMNAVIALVCVKGEVRLSSHSKECRVSNGKIFLSSAQVLQFDSIADSEFYVLAFGSDFLTSMNINIKFLVDIMTTLQRGACVIDVAAKDMSVVATMFKSFYDNCAKLERNNYIELSLRHLFCSIIYRIYDVVASATNSSERRSATKELNAQYFERLMQLLADNFREERSVEFYAEKMNISSKHLSRVIRTFTGKSVHQWIDDFVALEIKNLLRYSDMSVQQISYALNFPNPSFMGQYFKRITGMTPGEYRKG